MSCSSRVQPDLLQFDGFVTVSLSMSDPSRFRSFERLASATGVPRVRFRPLRAGSRALQGSRRGDNSSESRSSGEGVVLVKTAAAWDHVERREFTAFVRAHERSCRQWYIRRWGLNAADAAEVCQDTFVGLAGRWLALRTDEHRRRCYATIRRNKVVDFLRARSRELPAHLSLDDLDREPAEPSAADPAVMLAGDSRHAPLWAAVEGLPRGQRAAVVGRVVLAMSYDELADVTGRSPGALRSDFCRGLAWLRHALGVAVAAVAAACGAVRRSARSARQALSSTAVATVTVASQATLLGLVFTAPLPVLPHARSLDEATLAMPSVLDRLAEPVQPAASAGVARFSERTVIRQAVAILAVPRRGRNVATTGVVPPKVCVKRGCGTGDRITVHVLGQEREVSQETVEMCWAFPVQAEPFVTCRPGGDPP